MNLQTFAVSILPLILAITLHEAAHGWVADRLGDSTAKMLGRLTLNPIKHIDPIGTIVVPVVMSLMTGFVFGWAKPVPVNTRNLKNPRKDMAAVAVAGPASNLLMAIAWALVWKMAPLIPQSLDWMVTPMTLMGFYGVLYNLFFMILNILPIPPLDGSRILAWLVPPTMASRLDQMENYGFFIIIGLLFLGLWQYVIQPLTNIFISLLIHILNLPLNIFT